MGRRKAGPSAFVPLGALPLDATLDYGLAAMSAAIARRVVSFVSAVAACAALTAPADAEPRVRGRLEGYRLLQNPVWSEARDPKAHGYSFREPVPTVRADFRRLYPHIPKELCVAALAATPQKAQPTATLIRVGGGRTTPVTIVVAPGTKLVFKNTDPFKHRLYAVGQKLFTANDTAQGATREWTVPEPGVYEIRDEAAPSLRMWVVSEPLVAAIAYPSLKGDFAVPVEQPGEYRIRAYFAGKAIGPELPVTIAAADVEIKGPIRLLDEKAAAKAAKEEAESSDKAEGEAAKPAEAPAAGADSAKP